MNGQMNTMCETNDHLFSQGMVGQKIMAESHNKLFMKCTFSNRGISRSNVATLIFGSNGLNGIKQQEVCDVTYFKRRLLSVTHNSKMTSLK